MKRPIFRSIQEVLQSGLHHGTRETGSDRVLHSTRLEDRLYADLRSGDEHMDRIEAESLQKLSTFDALSRDVYQSFYALGVRHVDDGKLSYAARHFNSPILDDLVNGEDYPTIKSICEGRQLPAYEAAVEFTQNISDNLDTLLDKIGGDKGSLGTLQKSLMHEDQLRRDLDALLERREQQGPDDALDKQILEKADKVAGKMRQIKAIETQIHSNLLKNKEAIGGIVSQAMDSAKEKAEETALTIAAWGQGDSDASPQKMALARDTMDKVRSSATLKEVTRLLGRFKEMAAKARKNSYAYGRGEKYAIELGNDLGRALTSEFSMLAVPAAIPLFLRKYQNRRLQQYKRREAVFKGSGDIIMCLDESGSTEEDAPWGKAVALTLLDAAMIGNRKFALIHFSSRGVYQTDLFIPGEYDTADVLKAAETFLDGNTDFETPLKEALRLISQEDFKNADIVFVTDGVCKLPEAFRQELIVKQSAHGFKVTGILLDVGSPGMSFSLTPFCDEIFRTSELSQDKIVESLIAARL